MKTRSPKSLLLIIFSLLVLLSACSKTELPENVVAQVGPHNITVDDFKRAYLPVLLYSDKKESPQTREEILNFLINQTILAEEARLLKLDTIPTLDVLKRTAQKTAFTRILYKQWVKDIIPSPSETELRTAYQRNHHSRLVRHLFFDDKARAEQSSYQLSRGANWDSLALETFEEPSLAASGGVLGWMKFGDMDPDFEKGVYELSLHQISEPIQTKFGWHIIRVDEESKELMLTEYDYSLERRHLRRVIRERHEQHLADSVANGMMAEANLVFDPDIAPKVWTLMRTQVRQIFEYQSISEQLNPELGNFEDQLEPLLNEEMLRFDGTVWTVQDFLERLPEMNRQMMLTDLKQATAFLVRDEIIYKKGLQQKLDTREDVRGEIRDRENQFLSNLYLHYRAESQPVSDRAIQSYYSQYASSRYQALDSLHIYELIFSDIETANRGKIALENGSLPTELDQELLPNKYTDLGWFQGARVDRTDYYHRLVNLPLNTPVGPLGSGNKFTLIMARKRHRHSKPLHSIMEQVRFDAEDDRLNKLRLSEIKKLSEGKQIRVDLQKLQALGFNQE